MYAEELLDNIKTAFIKNFGSEFKRGSMIREVPIAFDPHFEKCLRRAQNKNINGKKNSGTSKEGSSDSRSKQTSLRNNDEDDAVDGEGGDVDEEEDENEDGKVGSPSGGGNEIMSARARLKQRALNNKGNSGSKKSSGKKGSGGGSMKEGTVWRDGSHSSKKLSKSAELELDFSKKNQKNDGESVVDDDELRLREYQVKDTHSLKPFPFLFFFFLLCPMFSCVLFFEK